MRDDGLRSVETMNAGVRRGRASGRTVLHNIRRAIAPTGRLLIIEVPLPERIEGPHPAVELDLIMLVLTGGKERTIGEYRALLEETGFSLARVYPEIAAGGIAVLEAEPV